MFFGLARLSYDNPFINILKCLTVHPGQTVTGLLNYMSFVAVNLI